MFSGGKLTPRTKEQLKTALNCNSVPALDNHLKPLREADLIHQRTNDEGLLTFEWSKLFKSVPKSSRSLVLLGTPNAIRANNRKS
jgi:hypothetical protein